MSPAKARNASGNDEDSWETDSGEEEEVHHGKSSKEQHVKTDLNSNLNNQTMNKSSDGAQTLEQSMKSLNVNDDQSKQLYTWGSRDAGALLDTTDDWNIEMYNKRQLPGKAAMPVEKEFWDVHIVNVFDPTNFVVSSISEDCCVNEAVVLDGSLGM